MIFRICDPERARHVSWTPNLGKALEYAPGGENSLLVAHPDAHLYSVIVEPVHVLAVLNDFEWMIDPTDVEITDHGTISNSAPQTRIGELPDSPAKTTLLAMAGEDYLVNVIDNDEPYEIRERETNRGHEPTDGAPTLP